MSEIIACKNTEFDELISVVVPIYGVATYLRQCLDSIVNQTYKNLEIILVDDGSTDGSAEICDEYSEKDSRIVVIHKENGGLVSARKAGVKRCTGRFTAYVDGDDWIDLGYIDAIVKKTGISRVDMVICNHIREGEKRVISEAFLKDGYYNRHDLEEKVFSCMLYAGGFYQFGVSQYANKVFRTELLKKYQLMVPNGISLGEDVALTFPMLLECDSIYIFDDPLYHYRFNREGMSLQYRERTTMDSKRLIEFLKEKLPDEYELESQLDYYNCLMALTNVVNTARGGLKGGFSRRIEALKIYLDETEFWSAIEKCDFKNKNITMSKRIGIMCLRFRLYRLAVILYMLKNIVIG